MRPGNPSVGSVCQEFYLQAASRAVGVKRMNHRHNILVADDEEMVRSILRLILAGCGYQVTEAVDGEDAVAQFTQASGHFDLVLLDRQMPGLTGEEALQRLRHVDPQLKAILLSGAVCEPELGGMAGPGGLRSLQKPFENQELIALVQEMIGTSSDTHLGASRVCS